MTKSSYKILLIEDDVVCAEKTADLLKKSSCKFEVTIACSLAEGIKECDGDHDLVLLDLRLPNGQGYHAFARLKKYCKDKPIIVLSNEEENALQCVTDGAQDYIIKPINPPALTRVIRYSVERFKAEERNKRYLQRIESIYRTAPVGMGVLDYDEGRRTLLEVNDRLCQMLEYKRNELVGQSALMVYPTKEEFERVGRLKYTEIMAAGVGTVETQWKTRSGKILDILLSSAYVDPDKPLSIISFSGLDITEKRQLQEKLRKELEKKLNDWRSEICDVSGIGRLETLING